MCGSSLSRSVMATAVIVAMLLSGCDAAREPEETKPAVTMADVQLAFKTGDHAAQIKAIHDAASIHKDNLPAVIELMGKAVKSEDWSVADAACNAALEIGSPALAELPGSHKRYFETKKCMQCHGRGKDKPE